MSSYIHHSTTVVNSLKRISEVNKLWLGIALSWRLLIGWKSQYITRTTFSLKFNWPDLKCSIQSTNRTIFWKLFSSCRSHFKVKNPWNFLRHSRNFQTKVYLVWKWWEEFLLVHKINILIDAEHLFSKYTFLSFCRRSSEFTVEGLFWIQTLCWVFTT